MQKFTEAQVTGKSTEPSWGPPPVQQMIRMYGTWDMAPLILSASSAAFYCPQLCWKLRRLVLKMRWCTLHYLHTQLVFLIVQIYVWILRQNGLRQKDHEDCKTITRYADSRRHTALSPGLEVFVGQRVTSKRRSEWKTCGIPSHWHLEHSKHCRSKFGYL